MSNVLQRELLEFNAASLTGTFQNFGSALGFAPRKVVFWNTSDVDVYITDGTSSEDIRIPATSSLSVGEGEKNGNYSPEIMLIFKKGAQLQIKQVTAAGTGAIIANTFG